MNLEKYFTDKQGVGVMATANREGEVNTAIYARPHVLDKNLIMFIMRDRKTRANLKQNKRANYLFIEHEHGYKGIRLYLTKIEEVNDQEAINKITRRRTDETDDEERVLVTFAVDKVIALVGAEEVVLA